MASVELDLRQAQTSVDSAWVDVARYTSLVAQDFWEVEGVSKTKRSAEKSFEKRGIQSGL